MAEAEDTRLLMCPENLVPGTTLGPIFYIVSAEQISRFRLAMDRKNSVHLNRQAHLAPPTMRLQDYALLISSVFRGGSGGIHASHKSEFYEPMRVGQAIKTEGRIVRTYTKRGKFFFELEYESKDAETDALMVRHVITSVLLRSDGAR
jgi:hypothetical protein